MAMPVGRTRSWTPSEVRKLIADAPLHSPRYELVDGELLVTPSPAYPHQKAVVVLVVALAEYLREVDVGEVLTSPSDTEVLPDQITQPDVFVLSKGEAARLRVQGFPARELLLAVEVVSPSSARYDRVVKRGVYQQRVPEYWVVDPDARIVERWRTQDARPEIVAGSLSWQPDAKHRAFTLDLAAFFGSVHGEG